MNFGEDEFMKINEIVIYIIFLITLSSLFQGFRNCRKCVKSLGASWLVGKNVLVLESVRKTKQP